MVRPLVLGIETSCDDTACAVLDGEGRVLSSVVSSQAAHRPYGGVVPEIASREHLANWLPVSRQAFAQAGVAPADFDLVAATSGPGLVGALLVGLSLGKALAFALGRPFHAVHHLEGHLYSPFLPPAAPALSSGSAGSGGSAAVAGSAGSAASEVPRRFIGLVLSGGHSSLFAVRDGEVEALGETRDDAMGEVFDKLGKRLGLPYPQGPRVDELAEMGRPGAAGRRLRAALRGDSLDFSFSGLKSQALLEVERLERSLGPLDQWGETEERKGGAAAPQPLLDLLADFRAAAVGQVLDRLERLARGRQVELLAVSGGAAANRLLRRELPAWAERRGVALRLVPLAYAGDNAAMIAFAALLRHRRGASGDPFTVEAESRVAIPAVQVPI